jgi:hypothetical protein
MLGWIIPAPFAMASTRTSRPPIERDMDAVFMRVSVVMMARATE